ncbi:hypothetical protein LOC67_10750 [Stieleria sp. JC731]|uniref:hypothetical protein n=1 Tax=Stieleria sp. JC731 TaxID=2894195 RepID=UPI001E574639|nr:hypothetical protein [Stieleria sp. JC731]MCC9601024.1 hypothetical protein [Stieleria sp. JC731]
MSSETGSGRFPVAAAWTGRADDGNERWRWAIDDEDHELSSLDAISSGASQLAKIHGKNAPSAIVIPNDFRQREQQKLLDACSAARVNASLLWLPVAAALAWLEQLRDTLKPPQSDSDDPLTLPIVHADWGQVRCSTLQLVPTKASDGFRWIPARRRPIVSDWHTPGFGWTEAAACDHVNSQTIWKQRFASSMLAHESDSSISESNLLEQIAGWSVEQKSRWQVDLSLADHLSTIPSSATIIFVGDFANQVASGEQVRRRTAAGQNPPFIADGVTGESLLARGAAVFARDRVEDRISYLDTLPDLELFVDRNHQYDWLSLLGDMDQFVPGGEEWNLPRPIDGLALRRGATSIKLVVAHDEYDGVRELQVRLDHPAELDLAARLHVSATPAQGNAKLRLLTEAYGTVPARSIQANWDRMSHLLDDEGVPIGKEAYAKSRPRAFPNLRPRPAEIGRWKAFRSRAKQFLGDVHGPDGVNSKYASLSRLLDTARVASGTSAVSSDGHVPPGEDQSIVDELTKLILAYVSVTPSAIHKRTHDEAVKLLGFMSADCVGMDAWIRREITQTSKTGETTCIIAGNCIRNPKTASIFVRKLLAEIPTGNKKRLLNYQMQALGRLLSQRQDAMSELRSQDATLLVQECINVFDDEIKKDNLAWLFEHSGLVVVYALRYRIYEQDFLDPDSALALRAKKTFAVAIEKLMERRDRRWRYGQSGNFVSQARAKRLLAALKQLIDYIDKRGEGDILIALDE